MVQQDGSGASLQYQDAGPIPRLAQGVKRIQRCHLCDLDLIPGSGIPYAACGQKTPLKMMSQLRPEGRVVDGQVGEGVREGSR